MKTFSTALIMGLCGALAVFISFSLGWPAWVLFMAWISYYLFGKTIKTSMISFLQIMVGILIGITIQTVSGLLIPILGSIGFPLTVFVIIGSLAYVSKIKILSNVPAIFIGLIIFFGVHPEIKPMVLLKLLIPVFVGFLFAIINDNAIKLVNTKNN